MASDHYCQWAIEQTPASEFNSPSVSTTVFYTPSTEIEWDVPPKLDDRSDELRGTPEGLPPDNIGFDAGGFTIHNRPYANNLGLFLFLLMGLPVTTAGNGAITDPDAATIPVGATRHVFDSALSPAGARTAQMTLGYKAGGALDVARYYRLKGATIESMNLPADFTANAFQAAGRYLYYATIADPSLTPAYDAPTIIPFYEFDFTVQTWLASTGIPGGLNYTLENPKAPFDTYDGSKSMSGFDLDGLGPVMKGELDTRYLTAADFAAFIAGTQFTVKTRWRSTLVIGATAYKYSMWVEGNAQYEAFQPEAMKHQIKHGAHANFTFGRTAAASAFKVTIVNSVASYSSVS